MTEGTLRQPHSRRYQHRAAEGISLIEVDDHGTVQISEELLDQFMTAAGWVETSDIADHSALRDAADSSDVQITCTPPAGILTVSAETVQALDALGLTITNHANWQIDVAIGWNAADTIHLTARPGSTERTAA